MLKIPQRKPLTLSRCLGVIALSTIATSAIAQPPAATQPPATQPPATQPPTTQQVPASPGATSLPPEAAAPSAPQRFDDPYSAYEAGVYDQALKGFVDQQVEYPEDPEVALNLGSVHFEMKNYEEAERAFTTAAMAADNAIRSQALYNLGNSAYRQGRLPEAVELFRTALELNPDDEDAKFNLEFVRDEIRRRHEEAQKRKEEQQQQEGDPQEQEQEQEGEDQQQGDQPQDQQGEPQEQEDKDGDGLGDETERSAQNPTDPENPDTDGDGLPDGQEDQNRNGQVDEGESDPNNPDSDGDGVSDGEEAQQEGEPQQGEATEGEEQEGLTPEEAERYLQALEEGLPDQKHRLPKGTKRARPEKDW
jgi:Ca-activated chloride channel family protein